MLIRQTEDRLSLSSASGLERLDRGSASIFATAVAGLDLMWSVELHYDALGKASIVIPLEDLDDVIGPTLIVHADQSSFHLEELSGDAYRGARGAIMRGRMFSARSGSGSSGKMAFSMTLLLTNEAKHGVAH